MTRKRMRLTSLACIALATSIFGCSTKTTIAPTPDALEDYVDENGEAGFLIQETGGREVAVAFVRKPILIYCSIGPDKEIPNAEECGQSPTFAGRLGHRTISGPDATFHCLIASIILGVDFTQQHAICVSSTEIDLVAERPPAGPPVPMEASAGEPFYFLQFHSSRDNREVLFNIRELSGSPSVAQAPAGAKSQCEQLAEDQVLAEAATSKNPNARTLREQALAQVEMVASGCPSAPIAKPKTGSDSATRPAPKRIERQQASPLSSAPAPAPALEIGFLEWELGDIANGCNYSAKVRELYDAYGPTESWDDSGNGRWTISLAYPDGGKGISPEFGIATFTLNEDEGYTHLSIPVQNGSLYGLPVSELSWSKGLDNGINIFSVGFALPLTTISERMAERGIHLKAGEYDEEMMMSITPELVRNEQTGVSYLVCDEST